MSKSELGERGRVKLFFMKLSEFLKKDGIEIYSNSDPLANEIKFNVSYRVDMEKNIDELTDEEIYEVFHHIIMHHSKEKPYFKDKIISIMKSEFKKLNSAICE